jgi:hypothetical protein
MSSPTVLVKAPVAAAVATIGAALTGVAPPAHAVDCTNWGFPVVNTIAASGDDDWLMTWSNPELGQTVFNAPTTLTGFGDNPPLNGNVDGAVYKVDNGPDTMRASFRSADSSVSLDLFAKISPQGNAVESTVTYSPQTTWRTGAPMVCTDIGANGGTVGGVGPVAAPKAPPTITSDQVIGGIVVHVKNNTPDTTKCHYDSDVIDRDFTLEPDATTDLKLVPALPLFRTWHVVVTCDNDTKGEADIDF